MIGSAARHNGNIADMLDFFILQIVKHRFLPYGDAPQQGIPDGLWLLVDFLEHKMVVARFFGRVRVKRDVVDFPFNRFLFMGIQLHAILCQHGEFVVLQQVYFPRLL